MTKIELTTHINGSVAAVFDLSRSIDFHIKSTKNSKEKAIAGVTSGKISLGQSVTWRGKHFGLLGIVLDRLFIKRHLKNFLLDRNSKIKLHCETK